MMYSHFSLSSAHKSPIKPESLIDLHCLPAFSYEKKRKENAFIFTAAFYVEVFDPELFDLNRR